MSHWTQYGIKKPNFLILSNKGIDVKMISKYRETFMFEYQFSNLSSKLRIIEPPKLNYALYLEDIPPC